MMAHTITSGDRLLAKERVKRSRKPPQVGVIKHFGKLVRLQGPMRTYFVKESLHARLNRIQSETQRRLNGDQINRKHKRCLKCRLRIRSKDAHECKRKIAI